jgi:Derlin-2/3
VAGQFVLFSELNLQGLYLPWAMLPLDLLFGNPLMPDILGIVAGHLYYFLTVLHPLAGGRYVFRTPYLVYPFHCLCSTFATHACTKITLTTS